MAEKAGNKKSLVSGFFKSVVSYGKSQIENAMQRGRDADAMVRVENEILNSRVTVGFKKIQPGTLSKRIGEFSEQELKYFIREQSMPDKIKERITQIEKYDKLLDGEISETDSEELIEIEGRIAECIEKDVVCAVKRLAELRAEQIPAAIIT